MANVEIEEARSSRWRKAMLGPLPNDFLRISSGVDAQVAADCQAAAAVYQQQVYPQYVAPNYVGRLSITCAQAKLARNYGLTRMDPYVRIRVGHYVYETQTDPNGGKHPHWNRVIQSQLPVGVNSIFVEIYDECSFKMDELIAWCEIKIPQSVMRGETHEEWYPLSGKQGEGLEGAIDIVLSFSNQPLQPCMYQTMAGGGQMLMVPPGRPMPIFVTPQQPAVGNTVMATPAPPRQLSEEEFKQIPTGICQVYNGTTCEKFLKNQSVFVPPNLSLNEVEERLKAAYGVIKESKDMNPNCRVYALPSICFSSLPLCRTPERTNLLYFSNRATQKERKSKKANFTNYDLSANTENHIIGYGRPRRFLDKNMKDRRPFFKRKSSITYDDIFTDEISSHYPPTRETENLRRICRDECELLENELCQKEYAIAKRHPVLGQKLPLEECASLPRHEDCSSLGITIDVNPEQDCYWENGAGYRGTLAVSGTGKQCLRWSWLMKEISDYPELAGQNYCRNPGNVEERPWCFVDDKSFEKIIELCDIPKCADKMWFYIFITIATLIGIAIFYMVYVGLKKRRNGGMTNIQNINTPNADKNIYGNSQVNSSLEMTRLNGNTNNEQPSMFSQNLERSSLLRVPQYTLQDMEFVEELGEGAFGKVYKGQLTQINGDKIFVAVKALKENASIKTQQDFKREIELISDLKHDNIVCILGVVLNKEPYCMLFEYMSNGDLHEFLIANSPSENKSLTQLEFLKISLQISEGMEYLSSHHYVHRDLAARNCLVGDKLTVKISDFGLSRDIYSSDYYRVQSKSLLPVRWMPSESILYGKFTTESDVWSFGVVLWEIYSYGMQPYYGHSNQEVINLVRSRQLLSCPEDCPTAVYSLMIECWHEQSVRRPSFSEIAHRLKVWYQGQLKLNSTPILSIKASPNT